VTPFAFELKDTSLPLVTMVLHQADAAVLAEELQRKLGDTPNFFDEDPVVAPPPHAARDGDRW
jgi:septum site-determining protein MinC